MTKLVSIPRDLFERLCEAAEAEPAAHLARAFVADVETIVILMAEAEARR